MRRKKKKKRRGCILYFRFYLYERRTQKKRRELFFFSCYLSLFFVFLLNNRTKTTSQKLYLMHFCSVLTSTSEQRLFIHSFIHIDAFFFLLSVCKIHIVMVFSLLIINLTYMEDSLFNIHRTNEEKESSINEKPTGNI